MKASLPSNERERLDALYDYQVLDTLSDQALDDITLLASEICETPIAAISLIDKDRQWFKARIGLDVTETSRETAFCAHAILNPMSPLIVEDATKDDRFADNPLVTGNPNIVFYAGAPLVSPEGFPLGTLCVIDQEPRRITEGQRRALVVLGRNAMSQLDLLKNVRDLRATIEDLRQTESNLDKARLQQLALKDQFISHVSHELRSPLTAMYQFMTILKDGVSGDLNVEQQEYVEIALRNAKQLRGMINDLFEVTRAGGGTLVIEPRLVSVKSVIEDTVSSLESVAESAGIKLEFKAADDLPPVVADPDRMRQVLVNLIENAIKFTDSGGRIDVTAELRSDALGEVVISVADTGKGIELHQQPLVFENLYQVDAAEEGRRGLGLGLYICRELVTRQSGRIWLESEPGRGSTFTFTVPRLNVVPQLIRHFENGAHRAGVVTLTTIRIATQSVDPCSRLIRGELKKAKNAVIVAINLADGFAIPAGSDADGGGLVRALVSGGRPEINTLKQQIEDQVRKSVSAEAEITVATETVEFPIPPETPGESIEDAARRLAGVINGGLMETLSERAA